MNINDYISSGILEAYVLGTLSKEEALKVEQLSMQHEEIKEEITSIEIAMENFANAHAKTPPSSLKTSIFNVLENTTTKKASVDTTTIKLNSKVKTAWSWAAASILIAILSSAFGIYSYTKWKGAEDRLVTLELENSVIANQVNFEKEKLENNIQYSTELISMFSDTATAKLKLGAVDTTQNYLAEVLWNKQNSKVFLRINNLPEPPSDKQYQLWALLDGVPVNAGVFDISDRFQSMNLIEGAQAFAVTLEDKGGKPTPNLEAMYLIGML